MFSLTVLHFCSLRAESWCKLAHLCCWRNPLPQGAMPSLIRLNLVFKSELSISCLSASAEVPQLDFSGERQSRLVLQNGMVLGCKGREKGHMSDWNLYESEETEERSYEKENWMKGMDPQEWGKVQMERWMLILACLLRNLRRTVSQSILLEAESGAPGPCVRRAVWAVLDFSAAMALLKDGI